MPFWSFLLELSISPCFGKFSFTKNQIQSCEKCIKTTTLKNHYGGKKFVCIAFLPRFIKSNLLPGSLILSKEIWLWYPLLFAPIHSFISVLGNPLYTYWICKYLPKFFIKPEIESNAMLLTLLQFSSNRLLFHIVPFFM